jgi:hypothetical protein
MTTLSRGSAIKNVERIPERTLDEPCTAEMLERADAVGHVVPRQVVVHRARAAVPGVVAVDDDCDLVGHQRHQLLQTLIRRLVPISVECNSAMPGAASLAGAQDAHSCDRPRASAA